MQLLIAPPLIELPTAVVLIEPVALQQPSIRPELPSLLVVKQDPCLGTTADLHISHLPFRQFIARTTVIQPLLKH